VNNIVAAPDGTYLATGSFSIGGQTYNLAKITPSASPVATGILPPNVSGASSASIYNVSSLNSDDKNNIYVSGQFGIVTSGQYQSSSLLKLDSTGNYLTNIAGQGSASNQVGALSGTNLVTINTHNQNVYVLDTANSALKVFALANPPSANPDDWLPVTLVDTQVNPATATLSYTTGKTFTSVIGAGLNADYEAGAAPDTFVNLTPSTNSFSATVQVTDTDGTKINVSFNFDKTTGDSIITSATPLGASDTSNGVGSSDGNGGLTSTASVTCENSSGWIYNSVVQASMNASGALTLVFTTHFPTATTGNSQTTTITWTPEASPSTVADITVQFPNILPGNEYVATTVVSNGVSSSNTALNTWVAPASLTIAVDKPTLSLAMTPGLNNGYDVDFMTVTTTTDSVAGYTLNVSAAEPRLSCTVGSNTYYIAPLTAVAAELPVSTWGYNLGTAPVAPATLPATPLAWLGMSATDTQFDSYDEATGSEGRNSYLYFASKIDMRNQACTYATQVMITAIAN
jgi:hypothetical protein